MFLNKFAEISKWPVSNMEQIRTELMEKHLIGKYKYNNNNFKVSVVH